MQILNKYKRFYEADNIAQLSLISEFMQFFEQNKGKIEKCAKTINNNCKEYFLICSTDDNLAKILAYIIYFNNQNTQYLQLKDSINEFYTALDTCDPNYNFMHNFSFLGNYQLRKILQENYKINQITQDLNHQVINLDQSTQNANPPANPSEIDQNHNSQQNLAIKTIQYLSCLDKANPENLINEIRTKKSIKGLEWQIIHAHILHYECLDCNLAKMVVFYCEILQHQNIPLKEENIAEMLYKLPPSQRDRLEKICEDFNFKESSDLFVKYNKHYNRLITISSTFSVMLITILCIVKFILV